MIRKLLLYILPFVLPFVLYGLYTWIARLRAAATGRPVVALEETPWLWLIAAGVGLFVVTLVAFSLFTGSGIEGTYVPPRMIDGEIAPAEIQD